MGKYFELINEEIKKAMLAKEKEKLEALRSIKSAFLLAKSENAQHELTDEKEISLMQKLHKQRLDSAAIYKSNNRNDLAEKELFEANVIEQFLPKMLSEEELTAELKKIIEELGVKSITELGKVMAVATKKLAGKAQNKDIADKVKQLLS
jgi:uncharacterized protein YqeY